MHEWRAGEAGRLFRLLVTDLKSHRGQRGTGGCGMKGEVGPGAVIQDRGSPNIRPPAEKAKSNSLGST